MKRLAVAVLLALVPAVPARAADSQLAAWVVERVSPTARTLTVRGGSGARDGEHAYAAVASATVDAKGRFTDADGALFFGIDPDGDGTVSTPAGDTGCHDLPASGQACALTTYGGVIGFAVGWEDATFDRVLVVLHGRDRQVDLGEDGSPGWRLRRWTGAVRVVTDADVSARNGLGRGLAVAGGAEEVGGPGGSVAIGRLPCAWAGYTSAGTGAARLVGGTREKVVTCATPYPAAAAAKGSTEWLLDGAGTGVSDTVARLVVVERPLP